MLLGSDLSITVSSCMMKDRSDKKDQNDKQSSSESGVWAAVCRVFAYLFGHDSSLKPAPLSPQMHSSIPEGFLNSNHLTVVLKGLLNHQGPSQRKGARWGVNNPEALKNAIAAVEGLEKRAGTAANEQERKSCMEQAQKRAQTIYNVLEAAAKGSQA